MNEDSEMPRWYREKHFVKSLSNKKQSPEEKYREDFELYELGLLDSPPIPPKLMKTKKQSLLKRKTLKGKETQIMDAKSTAHKVGDKAVITTDMNVSNGLSPKDKKALRASVMKALDNNIKGGMIYEETGMKKRGRPKINKTLDNLKGKGSRSVHPTPPITINNLTPEKILTMTIQQCEDMLDELDEQIERLDDILNSGIPLDNIVYNGYTSTRARFNEFRRLITIRLQRLQSPTVVE